MRIYKISFLNLKLYNQESVYGPFHGYSVTPVCLDLWGKISLFPILAGFPFHFLNLKFHDFKIIDH